MRTVNQCGRCGSRDKAPHKPGCKGRKVKTLIYGRADLNAARDTGYAKRPDNIRVYDNGGPDEGGSADRYTIIRTTPAGFYPDERSGWFGVYFDISANAAPFHPQGIGMTGETMYRPLWNAGKWGGAFMPPHVRELYKPARWSNLPEQVRKCAWQLAFDGGEA